MIFVIVMMSFLRDRLLRKSQYRNLDVLLFVDRFVLIVQGRRS